MMNHLLSASLVISTLLISINASAAPAPIITSTFDKSSEDETSFGIGATVSLAKRPFVGVDDQNTSLPYISYRRGNFYVEGIDFGYNLSTAHGFRLDLLATPRFYERKPSFANNGELDNLERTGETYLVGVSSQYHTSYGAITGQLLYDAIESDGVEAVLQFSNTFDITKSFKLTPSTGFSYQSATMIDHFYGVPPVSAQPGRDAYDGNSSVNYNITMNASWLVADHVELLAQFKYEWLGDGITDSSIVDENQLYFATLGVVYRF